MPAQLFWFIHNTLDLAFCGKIGVYVNISPCYLCVVYSQSGRLLLYLMLLLLLLSCLLFCFVAGFRIVALLFFFWPGFRTKVIKLGHHKKNRLVIYGEGTRLEMDNYCHYLLASHCFGHNTPPLPILCSTFVAILFRCGFFKIDYLRSSSQSWMTVLFRKRLQRPQKKCYINLV